MNKGREWVEGSVHDTREVIWANSYVLWINELTCDFSDHNKQNLIRSHQHWESGEFYWQHNYGIETKKRHNELVEEVVKRLAENNLYIKPEKYKWKVKEVEFLGVVIELEKIKMEEEKVKGMLD